MLNDPLDIFYDSFGILTTCKRGQKWLFAILVFNIKIYYVQPLRLMKIKSKDNE